MKQDSSPMCFKGGETPWDQTWHHSEKLYFLTKVVGKFWGPQKSAGGMGVVDKVLPWTHRPRARTLPNRVIFIPLTANTALRAETSYISLVQSIDQLEQFSKDALHHVTWENKWWRCKAKNRCQVICSSNPWTQQQPGGCLHLRKRRQCSAPARPDLLSRICTPPSYGAHYTSSKYTH